MEKASKEFLKRLADSSPVSFSSVIKYDPELTAFVNGFNLDAPTTAEKVYRIVNDLVEDETLLCERGNRKKYISYTKGYGFCGKAGVCACAKEDVSKKNTATKRANNPNPSKVNQGKLDTEALVVGDIEGLKKFIDNNRMSYSTMIRAFNPSIVAAVVKNCPTVSDPAELYYLYVNRMKTPPSCGCGKKLTFKYYSTGYANECKSCYESNRVYGSVINTALREQPETPPECSHPECFKPVGKTVHGVWMEHCSLACKGRHNSLVSRGKSRATMMGRYGVEYAAQNPLFQEKAKNTLFSNYGVTNTMQSIEIRERIKKTNLERYGVEYSFQCQNTRDKIKATMMERYGVPNASQHKPFHDKKLHKHKPYTFPSGKVVQIQGYEDKVIDLLLEHYPEESFTFQSEFPYELNGNTHKYFPDFELDGVVYEVKSTYTLYAEYEKNIAKFDAVARSGSDMVVALYDVKMLSLFDVNKTITDFSEYLEHYYNVTRYHMFDNTVAVDYYFDDYNFAIKVLSDLHDELHDQVYYDHLEEVAGCPLYYFRKEQVEENPTELIEFINELIAG